MDVSDALRERHSVRGFKSDPVPAVTLRAIFEDAQLSPSWCNIQPWRAWVTSGDRTAELKRVLTQSASNEMPAPDLPWPGDYPDPYGAWRRLCGKQLYEAMGVSKDDRASRYQAWMRNYLAFDAPHIAIVAIDKRLGIYAALDAGCWLQSILLSAVSHGIAACAQASLAAFPNAPRKLLGIPDDMAILCGIAIGYEDPTVPANACRADRAPLEENVVLL